MAVRRLIGGVFLNCSPIHSVLFSRGCCSGARLEPSPAGKIRMSIASLCYRQKKTRGRLRSLSSPFAPWRASWLRYDKKEQPDSQKVDGQTRKTKKR